MDRIGRLGLMLLVVEANLLLNRIGGFHHFGFLLQLLRFGFTLENFTIIGGRVPLADLGCVGGAGILQAAERIAVARVEFENALIGFLRLGGVFRLHVGFGQRVENGFIGRFTLGQGFIGKGFELRITERRARFPDHDIGFELVGILGQDFLRLDQLFLRRFFCGGKLHHSTGHPHARHLPREAARGLVFLDFNRA